MHLYMPERVIFEPQALEYPLGQSLLNYFQHNNIEIVQTALQNVMRYIPGNSEIEKYAHSRRTLVVSVKKSLQFDVCKPSADYEFSLITNCPGNCEYCYLQTTQGNKPYLRIYVNLEEIFDSIERHIAKQEDRITTFEVASAGDPLGIEHITGTLAKTITFFGQLDKGRLRVVTKFSNVEPLLQLKHNGHTRFRFSVSSRYVLHHFEHNTASFEERIEASGKMADAGYLMGFIVAPIMIYDGWKDEYRELFTLLSKKVNLSRSAEPLTFELIQHRFTPTAKKYILERFPRTKLDMDESKRITKWGKFGKFKYVYPKDQSEEIKEYLSGLIEENFPHARIEYFT